MPQKNRLFSNRQLLRLIIPLVIEQALSVLVGMCDGIMVSSVGETAIAGVSLVDMINIVVLTLFAALATGGAVVTSQYLGARQQENARQSVGQLVLLSGCFGLFAMVFCLVLGEGMMGLFFGSIEADVMRSGMIYFRITALSFPFVALYNAGAAVFRSMGNSKVSMQVSAMMNLINIAGNAVCIYGLKMGVAGVAVPTLVSRAAAAMVMMILAAKPEMELRLELRNLRRPERKMLRNILHIGMPSAFENSLFQLGRLVVVSMIALFGTYQTSANSIAVTLDNLGILIGQAMGLAMITVVGQCVGAGDMEQTVHYIKKLMLGCWIALAAANILILLFLPQLVGLYTGISPETRALAIRLVRIHASCAIVLWPISFVLPNAFRAANDVRFTMIVSVVSMAVWRVGFSWILCVRLGWGATGVWIAMLLDWLFRVVFFLGRLRSGKWKTKYCAV